MKHWTVNQQRSGNTVSPESVNDEIRTSASSIQTLDRAQLPQACIDDSNLELYALHRVWCEPIYPKDVVDREGEQNNVRDTSVKSWMFAGLTYQLYTSGWLALTPYTLTGFKGGNLFLEWSGNALVFPSAANQYSNLMPGVSKYCKVRMSANGVTVAERYGASHMEHWRLFGSVFLPPGDLQLQLEFQPTTIGPDEPIVSTAPLPILQLHLFSSKFFAMGRWR